MALLTGELVIILHLLCKCLIYALALKSKNDYNNFASLYASFMKGQGHQGIFLITNMYMYEEIVNFCLSISRAPRQ